MRSGLYIITDSHGDVHHVGLTHQQALEVFENLSNNRLANGKKYYIRKRFIDVNLEINDQ